MASPQSPPRLHQAMLCLSSQRYLRARPAVRLLLRGFLRELLLQRPDDVLEFAAGEGGGTGGVGQRGGGPASHSPLCPPPRSVLHPARAAGPDPGGAGEARSGALRGGHSRVSLQ
ncbi:RIIa domain-containing protein 1 [Harpia harpyja]|uniref:RIIa domain-containing protein 1 n=1 Tax=Harpia harpyja TaxID=202280 RepID=UPI0022B1FFF4|nr:RIIa domain-containing protein 1 [Harpia harpyja]